MKFFLLILPIFCVLLSSCEKNTYYASHDVIIKAEGYTNKGVELRFVTPPESLYYCPGLELNYEGEKVRYSYIRSHIDRTPNVDAKADYFDGERVVIIPFPPGKDRIELIDSSGKSLGVWQIKPAK